MSKETKVKKSKDPKTVQAAIMIAISCVFIVVAIVALYGLGVFYMIEGIFISEGVVAQGTIHDEELEATVSEGKDIVYYVNNEVVFRHEYAKGTIMFENPKDSKYDMQFFIYQSGYGGRPLYESPMFSPGEYIDGDKFTDSLQIQKGDYICTGVVKAYDSEGNYCGQNSCTIKVKVEK